jgi:hypothetical protein
MPLVLSKNECHKICVNSKHFTLIFSHIYQRSVSGILQQCVNYQEVPSILEICHDNACDDHFFRPLTMQKTLYSDYFWPTMFVDPHTHA